MFSKITKNIPLLFTISILILEFSCKKDPNQLQFQLGNDIVNANSKISVCDTFFVQLSTVQKDSLITSGADSLLIGVYKDDRLGYLQSKCYFRLNVPSSVTLNKTDIYDSICLMVNLNGYSYGDTTRSQKWNVYRLGVDMVTDNDGHLYNTSSFSHYEDALGNISFVPKPGLKQEIAIPLDYNLGKVLYNLVLNNDDIIKLNADFQNYFKGLVIESSNNNQSSLIGIAVHDTSIAMRIYAHRITEEKQSFHINFNLETGSLPFTQITSDRSSTLLKNLSVQRYALSSSNTNNESYIQGGSGLMTRVDIPGLSRVLESENTALMKAELILKPVVGTFNVSELPTKLLFAKCDKINRIVSVYLNSTKSSYLYGSLVKDNDLYNENTYYSIDITSYIKDVLSHKYYDPNANGIILYYTAPSFSVTASRIVFGDALNKNQKAQLKLYFFKYD